MERSRTLLKRRRTKIVATLGPGSSDAATVERLVAAGVNVFRLNFSHGDHATHEAAAKEVRRAAGVAGAPVALLADLCGPKIRVGRFPGGSVELVDGEQVTVTTRDVLGGPGLIPSQYGALAADVTPGCRILLADGLLELRVDAVDGTEVTCTVVHGGTLGDRKGMNLPDVEPSAPCLTEKDKADATFAAALGVDYLALSFVRRPRDVTQLRELLGPGGGPRIIAKIEHPAALGCIEEIVDVADGIMVARGDLGVELRPEEVPVIQRELVLMGRARRKPVIVATQMLESMIEHPQPTRAEVSDVSTAVLTGADAVMLSAETATGRHPIAAVEMLDRIARQIEGHLWSSGGFQFPEAQRVEPFALEDAVARSTAQLSRDLAVRAVIVLSSAGDTARVLSSARPAAPLVAVAADEGAACGMALLWGVVPQVVRRAGGGEGLEVARRLATDLGLASAGQRVLVVDGFDADSGEPTPTIRVLAV
jgi:pyruvate kinase